MTLADRVNKICIILVDRVNKLNRLSLLKMANNKVKTFEILNSKIDKTIRKTLLYLIVHFLKEL